MQRNQVLIAIKVNTYIQQNKPSEEKNEKLFQYQLQKVTVLFAF